MKFLVTLLWLGFAAVCFGEGKFAVVRVTDIYRELPSTAAMQKRIQERRVAILGNERAENFRKIITEMQTIQSQLKIIREATDTEIAQKIIRDYEIKRQEAETLRQEFENYKNEQEKQISIQLVSEMRSALKRVTDASVQIAKERNLDGVFDISGSSNTGVPFVLYSKDAEDLTEDVMGMLTQEDIRAAEKENAAAEASEADEQPQE